MLKVWTSSHRRIGNNSGSILRIAKKIKSLLADQRVTRIQYAQTFLGMRQSASSKKTRVLKTTIHARTSITGLIKCTVLRALSSVLSLTFSLSMLAFKQFRKTKLLSFLLNAIQHINTTHCRGQVPRIDSSFSLQSSQLALLPGQKPHWHHLALTLCRRPGFQALQFRRQKNINVNGRTHGLKKRKEAAHT